MTDPDSRTITTTAPGFWFSDMQYKCLDNLLSLWGQLPTRLTPNSSLICLHLHYPAFQRIPFLSFVLTQPFPHVLCVFITKLVLSLPHFTLETTANRVWFQGIVNLCNHCSQQCGILKILHTSLPNENNTDPRDEFTHLISLAMQ